MKTNILHGDLEVEIYIEQPERFKIKGKENILYKLRKSLYNHKQAPRQWYKKFDAFMIKHGYSRTTSVNNTFLKIFFDGHFILLLLYVNDILIVGQDAKKIGRLKKELIKSFDMNDLGPLTQIFGIKISDDRKTKKILL